jgi:hypothetical protein
MDGAVWTERVQALPGNELLRDLPLNSMLWERCLAMAFIP